MGSKVERFDVRRGLVTEECLGEFSPSLLCDVSLLTPYLYSMLSFVARAHVPTRSLSRFLFPFPSSSSLIAHSYSTSHAVLFATSYFSARRAPRVVSLGPVI